MVRSRVKQRCLAKHRGCKWVLRTVPMRCWVFVPREAIPTRLDVRREGRRRGKHKGTRWRVQLGIRFEDVRCHAPELLSRLVEKLRAFGEADSKAIMHLGIEVFEQFPPSAVHCLH